MNLWVIICAIGYPQCAGSEFTQSAMVRSERAWTTGFLKGCPLKRMASLFSRAKYSREISECRL